MKIALLLVLAAGCIPQPEPPPPDPYDYDGGGWTGPQDVPVTGCESSCGSLVCARNGQCYPASSIRLVTTTWTVGGEKATATTCAGHPDLFIHFAIPVGDSFGFAPVPCKNGKFTIDKLPTAYTRVELGVEGATYGTTAVIMETNDAVIDMP